MKQISLALVLAVFGCLALPQDSRAGELRLGVTVGQVQVQLGGGVFNQRLVPVFQAWVNEPYIFWRVVPDPANGRVYRVPEVRYTRRLVWVYYDRVTNAYGYFDRFGNPVPYQVGGYGGWGY